VKSKIKLSVNEQISILRLFIKTNLNLKTTRLINSTFTRWFRKIEVEKSAET